MTRESILIFYIYLHSKDGEYMALVNCPECGSEVSSSALDCPKCGFLLNKPKRSFFGKIIKWSFIIFNVIMFLALFSYCGEVAQISEQLKDDAAKAGAGLGAAIGSTVLLVFWAIVDFILGFMVLLTRPKR